MKAPRTTLILIGIILLVAAGIFTLSLVQHFDNQPGSPFLERKSAQDLLATLPVATMQVGGENFQVFIAETSEDRQQGLSFVESLGDREGMLFVFDTTDMYRFWMKDMNFSLDIIWLDDAGVIVDIASQVTLESYPELFAPVMPARYVLEVNAGTVEQLFLKKGDQIFLP